MHSIKIHMQRSWRVARWKFSKFVFVAFGIGSLSAGSHGDDKLLGPFEKPRPKELLISRGSDLFDVAQALNGALSSPEQCAHVPNGIWIDVKDGGECIRYYAHGFGDGENPVALVYFSGDVILRTARGARHISKSYAKASPMKIEKDMAEWSAEAQRPTIFLARPGIYGSSGDHNLRRRPREIELMSRALDILKARFKISSLILAGQSGGGQIAAALLNQRSDIEAAVFSSGLLSVKQVTAFWEYRREIPGKLLDDATTFYDPVDEIDHIRRDPMPVIYVISDPEDRSVPFYSQLYYVRRLRSIGFNPHHVYAYAAPPQRHVLGDHAKRAAALLARGQSEKEVRRALQELDLLQVKP